MKNSLYKTWLERNASKYDDQDFILDIAACEGSFTISNRYNGYIEYSHGLEQGSGACTCKHKTHYVCLQCGSVRQGLDCACYDRSPVYRPDAKLQQYSK